jgi:hypothetical protein
MADARCVRKLASVEKKKKGGRLLISEIGDKKNDSSSPTVSLFYARSTNVVYTIFCLSVARSGEKDFHMTYWILVAHIIYICIEYYY